VGGWVLRRLLEEAGIEWEEAGDWANSEGGPRHGFETDYCDGGPARNAGVMNRDTAPF